MPRSDISGMRFGKLTAVSVESISNGKVKWLCHCDCGKDTIVALGNLKNGHTQSCGCIQKEYAKASATTHGMSKSRLYRTWAHMKDRCLNPNIRNYKDYGGRGITFCKEWMNFDNFYQWALLSGYSDNLTIDRIDNNKGYSPDNCRWIPRFKQASNKRNNHLFTIDGVTDTMTNWARKFGIKPTTVFCRLSSGWSELDALTVPVRVGKWRNTG